MCTNKLQIEEEKSCQTEYSLITNRKKFFLRKIFHQNSLIVQFDETMTQSHPSSQSDQERLWPLIGSIQFNCLLANHSSILWHICFLFPGLPLYFLIFFVYWKLHCSQPIRFKKFFHVCYHVCGQIGLCAVRSFDFVMSCIWLQAELDFTQFYWHY